VTILSPLEETPNPEFRQKLELSNNIKISKIAIPLLLFGSDKSISFMEAYKD
jgi:hypothetical protein